MRHTSLLACLAGAALALAACSPAGEAPQTAEPAPAPTADAPEPPAPATGDTLTADGWGKLKIGMTKDAVVAAVGPDAHPDAVGGPDPESCDEFEMEGGPDGLFVMIQDGKLTRISLTGLATPKTVDGFGLGDPADKVKAFYGARAAVTPHKYQDAPAEYITVWQGGPRGDAYVQDESARGIVYEIDGTGHVGAIHAGGPSIQYVEGCA